MLNNIFQQNCAKQQEVFIYSDIWTAHLKPNHFRKKLPMGYYQDRMGRSLFDFEWSNSTVAHIS